MLYLDESFLDESQPSAAGSGKRGLSEMREGEDENHSRRRDLTSLLRGPASREKKRERERDWKGG